MDFDFDYYGGRVSGSGLLLDPSGIPISTGTGGQLVGSVASDGLDYFVVWEDGRAGPSRGRIRGARITASGLVLDPGSIDVSGGAGTGFDRNKLDPAVAFNGTVYLAVWLDQRDATTTGGDIYGARVANNGVVLDPDGFPISTAPDSQFQVAVASNGIHFLVVWQDKRNGVDHIFGARVDSGGNVLDPGGIPISTNGAQRYAPSVASDGTDYSVVWQVAFGDIFGSRVTAAGSVLDPAGIAIATATGRQVEPAVASNGLNYAVVWEDWRNGDNGGLGKDIFAAGISPAGLVLIPNGVSIGTASGFRGDPQVTSDSSRYLAAWEDRRLGGRDIFGQLFSIP